MKGKRQHILDRRGYSLVEVVLALAIMGIAMVPIIDSFALSYKTIGHSQTGLSDTALAVNLAREKMEELMAMEFNAVDATLSDTVTVSGNAVNRDVKVEPFDGNGNGIVDSVADPMDNNIKKITVTVGSVQLQTLKVRY
jgi:prepilin-type N-terminal cleavage/methylation domain-containing protein